MTPMCCDQEAKWVVQSITLSYWFCVKCRKEVTAPVYVEEVKGLKYVLSQDEIDRIFASLP